MEYYNKIEENRDLQIKTLQELISIRSVASDPVASKEGEKFPFGRGVQDAFAYTLKKAEELGFDISNIDNYGGHIDFGEGKETVGILGHLDVVPEGEGWTFDPYGGTIEDGKIYGRGTTDDKGPVVAALFAMKALKASGYEPAKRVRLILGLDEETNWAGMKYYMEKVGKPDYGFTPDADFPALNGEKGIMTYEIAKKFAKSHDKGLELRSLTGGSAANMVAEKARAVVRNKDTAIYEHIKEEADKFRKETGYKLYTKGVGKSLEILAEGKAAHASTPEAGLNGISVIMNFLGKLNFENDDINDFIDFYNQYIGFDLYGETLSCDFQDDKSGKLTQNVGLIHFDREAITVTINVRYPVTRSSVEVYDAIMPIINKYNLGIIKVKDQDPIYMDPHSKMIETLVSIYQKHTGDTKSEPIVIGGGTYARAAENVIAFGAHFPGEPDLMHQKDEYVSIDNFMKMTRIYADAIFQLTQADFNILEEQ